MKELSLNILDITENSVKAGATLTRIELEENGNVLCIRIIDNGCGMTPEFLEGVINPFCTTRTTRKVGLGIPLIKLAAEQTGGSLTITSRHESTHPEDHGTEVTAIFHSDHIDCAPLGDIVSTIRTLIHGHPETDFYFSHQKGEARILLDTREMRRILGDEIPLNAPEILEWISGTLTEQYAELNLGQ